MPSKKFMLSKNKKQLEISWRGNWDDISISIDGTQVGTIKNKDHLKIAKSFSLEDGSILRIQLVEKFMSAQLRILENGIPLPGSDFDSVQRIKSASALIYLLGAINFLLGTFAEVAQVKFLLKSGMGWPIVIFGLILLFLGYFARRGQPIAFAMVILLLITDITLTIIATKRFVGGIIVKVFFILIIGRGYLSSRELKNKKNTFDIYSFLDKNKVVMTSVLILSAILIVFLYFYKFRTYPKVSLNQQEKWNEVLSNLYKELERSPHSDRIQNRISIIELFRKAKNLEEKGELEEALKIYQFAYDFTFAIRRDIADLIDIAEKCVLRVKTKIENKKNKKF